MRLVSHRVLRGCILAALLQSSPRACAEGPGAGSTASTPEPTVSTAVMAEYRHKLDAYNRARQSYDADANAYWTMIAQLRRLRNEKRRNHQSIVIEECVLSQPTVYSEPPRPVDPSRPQEAAPARPEVPVVADFIQAAAEQFNFVPQRPHSQSEYRRAYANTATAAGFTRDQVVRIYGFESGGNGRFDVQAGLEYASPRARAINTALGYNQLLNTNSVRLMAEQGDKFIDILTSKAATLSRDGNGLDMITMPKTMPERVPTSNFFQQGGYERNPVASRNNVVARLIAATNAKMDQEVSLPGARELAAAF